MSDERRRADGRRAMVARLEAEGIVDALVLRAMAEIPRHRFVAPELADEAYGPRPLPIGAGATISSPWIVAVMAAALRLTGEERVLEVGAGSGYAAAVLSRCARTVVTVEAEPDLADGARRALAAAGCPDVAVRCGDGALGDPGGAPFDAVSVAAMAPRRIPPALLEQVTPSGTVVCPVGRRRRGHLVRWQHGRTESLAPVSFVPLRPV